MSNGNGKTKNAEEKPALTPEESKDPKAKEEEKPPPGPEEKPAEKEKSPDIPDALKGKEKPPEKPELPPIKLLPSQEKLYKKSMIDHQAMQEQAAGIVKSIAIENQRFLVEGFASELGIDLMEKKYEFDRETLTFIDYNILRQRAQARSGMPQMRIPGGKR